MKQKEYKNSRDQIIKAEMTILNALSASNSIGVDLTKNILYFSIQEFKNNSIDIHSLSLIGLRLLYFYNTPDNLKDDNLVDFLFKLSELSFFMYKSEEGDEKALEKVNEFKKSLNELDLAFI